MNDTIPEMQALEQAGEAVLPATNLRALDKALELAGPFGRIVRVRNLADVLDSLPVPWSLHRDLKRGLPGNPTVGELLNDRVTRRQVDRLVKDQIVQLIDLLRDFTLNALLDQRGRLLVERAEQQLVDTGGRRLRGGMHRPELDRWIEQMGVTHWAGLPVAVLLDEDVEIAEQAWIETFGATACIADLISDPGRDQRGERPPPRQLRDRAIDRLGEQARRTALGLRDEADRPPLAPPELPSLRELHDRLLAAREHVRDHVPPRPYQGMVRGELEFDAERMALVYRERLRARCGGEQSPEVTVSVRPLPPEGVVNCDCRRRERAGRCPVALAALDAAMTHLATDPDLQDEIATELDRPEWSRLLERVDRVLPPPILEAEDRVRLGWRVIDSDSGIELKPVECRPTKRGSGTGARSISWRQAGSDPDLERLPTDLEVMSALGMGYGDQAPTYGGDVAAALRLLDGHPRLFAGARGTLPLAVRPARVDLRLDVVDGRFRWLVRADDAPLDPAGLRELIRTLARPVPAVLDEDLGLCRVFHLPRAATDLLQLLDRSTDDLSSDAADAFLERIPRIEALLPVELGEGLAGQRVAADSSPVVRLELEPDGALRVRLRARPLPDGPLRRPGSGSPFVHVSSGDGLLHTRRDLAAELADSRALAGATGLRLDDLIGLGGQVITDIEASMALLEQLERTEPVTQVEWVTSHRRRVVRAHSAGSLRIALRRAGDWFGVTGSLEVDGGSISLEELLSALDEGRRFVQVDGERWAVLSDELRSLVAEATAGVIDGEDGRTISPIHAPVLQQLADAGAQLDAPSAWLQTLDRIREAAAWEPELPADLVGDLRPYQLDGYRWLARLSRWAGGACLADDMGLGKTVQALALLLARRAEGPALVVAPTSVGWNWLQESARFSPSLRTREYRGPDRADLLDDLADGDVLVTSWTLLHRDRERLAARTWGTFVLDEAQAIKNPDAERTRAARLIQADFRVALTGTPVENRTSELWSLFRVLIPGLLDGQAGFRRRFVVPIEQRQDATASQRLAAMIRPFMLRRLKGKVEAELPPRTEIVHRVVLSAAERQLYEGIRTTAAAALGSAAHAGQGQVRFQVLAALTKLRQASCHPRLVDASSTVPSAKEKALLRIVADLRDEGHRALIFSQFVRHLELARSALRDAGWRCLQLDGSTPAGERRRLVEEFQAGSGDVFLISLKAGGTGLNLTGATYVIHLDPWWNPAVEDQASDRTHRIGQTRPVTVYRLVAGGTVEDKILQMQADKRELVEALISGADRAAPMSVDELVQLLTEGPGDEPGHPADDVVVADPG